MLSEYSRHGVDFSGFPEAERGKVALILGVHNFTPKQAKEILEIARKAGMRKGGLMERTLYEQVNGFLTPAWTIGRLEKKSAAADAGRLKEWRFKGIFPVRRAASADKIARVKTELAFRKGLQDYLERSDAAMKKVMEAWVPGISFENVSYKPRIDRASMLPKFS
ncbi:MAG: hypothetical protein V1787_01475 [Candidatus Micrarchaeota archaeon]